MRAHQWAGKSWHRIHEKHSEWLWGYEEGYPYLCMSPLNFFAQKSGGYLL